MITDLSHYLTGLTPADLEINDLSMDGTSNGIDSDDENEVNVIKVDVKEEDVEDEQAAQAATPQHVLTPFELDGLWNLVGKLEELPAHKKCVPAGIRNAAALLEDMKVSFSGLTWRTCVLKFVVFC